MQQDHLNLKTLCPTDADLQEYLSGILQEEPALLLEQHLAHCTSCRNRLPQAVDAADCPTWADLMGHSGVSDVSMARCSPVTYTDLPPLETCQTSIANRTDAVPKQTSSADHLTAPILPPRFVPIRRIGAGGMGEVWEVLDSSIGRSVAIKFLRTNTPALQDIQRLLREASALGRFSHPGIVRIHEVLTLPGPPAIVMEYVRGPSLRGLIHGHTVSDSDAAELMVQVAAAVSHAHQHGVIHRDLKPSNILLQPVQPDVPEVAAETSLDFSRWQPMISDFGTARFAEDQTITVAGQIVGTPAYIAPEQIAGNPEQITPAVDIYGLGAILYELLTGRPPFITDDPAATLALVREGDPLRPRLLQPRVSPDLENICLKCLSLAPADRYPTAAALQQDLQAFLDGRPVLARPVSPTIRAVRWIRRNRVLAMTLTGLALSLVGILAESIYFGFSQTRLLKQTEEAEDRAVASARQAADRARLVEYHLNSAVSVIDTLVVQLNPQSPGGDPVSRNYRRSLYTNVLQLYQDYMTYFCPDQLIPIEHIDEAQRFLWLKNEVDPQAVTDAEILRLTRSLDALTAEQKQASNLTDVSIGLHVIIAQRHRRTGQYAAAAQTWTDIAGILQQKRDSLPEEHTAIPEVLRYRCGMLMNASLDYRQGNQPEQYEQASRQILDTLRQLLEGPSPDPRDLPNFLVTAHALAAQLQQAGRHQEAISLANDALSLHSRTPISDPGIQHAANDLCHRISTEILRPAPPN